jgi:hypothetical protein
MKERTGKNVNSGQARISKRQRLYNILNKNIFEQVI